MGAPGGIFGRAAEAFPRADGDVTVLGPEVFVSSDGSVISFRGENYYRDEATGAVGALAARLLHEACEDLLDDTAMTALLDRDDQLANKGFRTLFSSEGRVALRAAIVRRTDV